MPKQIPKYGTLFSLAYFAANIMPFTPRSPNPPGTKTHDAFWEKIDCQERIKVLKIENNNKSLPLCLSLKYTNLNYDFQHSIFKTRFIENHKIKKHQLTQVQCIKKKRSPPHFKTLLSK